MFPRTRYRHVSCGLMAAVWLSSILLCAAAPRSLQAQTTTLLAQPVPLELLRYRVDIELTFSSDPMLPPVWQESTIGQIHTAIERSLGAMWDFRIANTPRLRPVSGVGLQRFQDSALLEIDQRRESYYGPVERLDKKVFLTVSRQGGRYLVSGREWDTRVRTLSRVKSAFTYQRRMIVERVVDVLLQLFRPVLVVDSASGDVIEMRVQAGEYPAPDKSAEQVRKGDIVFPVLRYRDKQRVVQKVQFLPSTYVVVQKVDRARVSGVLVSGLRMTLSGRGRRRVDQMGLRRRPDYGHSDVDFVLRANARKSLVGNRVQIYGKTRANDKTDAEPLEFLTDRRGRIRIPQRDQFPMLWLYIHSGDVLLARVPYAAGFEPNSTLQLLDDSIRLGVEGELNLIEGMLIDTIAQRAVFMVLARKRAEAGDKKGMTENLERIDALDGRQGLLFFQSRLNEVRVPALERARETRNRIAESRVTRLCDKLRDVVVKSMDSKKTKEFKSELDELLKDAQENAKKDTKDDAK